MTVESFHGRCRACGHGPVLARWGSGGWAWFEVCPACGFAVSTGEGTWPKEGPELAAAVLQRMADHLEPRGVDPRRYWYARSLVCQGIYDPEAPAHRLIAAEDPEAVAQHWRRNPQVLTPQDVLADRVLMAYLEAEEPEVAERLRELFA